MTWTHYRLLLRVKDEPARNWYMNEAAKNTANSFWKNVMEQRGNE
ncbi:MAG: hypothetical protein J6X11_09685 [Treponema sp.]|nr:hypothetical protein [Treponema sp.]